MHILSQSDGVSFRVRVHPRARKNEISGELGDALKLSLTAPPVDGKANDATIEFFAKLLKAPRSSFTIASGQSSRNKVICVTGLSAEAVRKRIGMQRRAEVTANKPTRARASAPQTSSGSTT
jgi:uncharacterized protein (TIGR00251 family)